jgi:hypothetical protein
MRRGGLLACVALLALPLGGCGGRAATLDATTDASTEASMKVMTAEMSDAERKRFLEDCEIAALPSQFETTPPAPGQPKGKYRGLHGLTADDIRARALPIRDKLSSGGR